MLFRRLYEPSLAQAAYLIACQRTGEALVVDPTRDAGHYVRAAEEEGVRITAVTETHIHADFLSGSRELARRTGGILYLSGEGGATWRYPFAGETGVILVREGDAFTVGQVLVKVMHVPGHTPEHLAFLVTDTAAADAPMGVITGDSLFVGDVGRPDLLVKTRRDSTGAAGDGTPADAAARELDASARTLYRTMTRFAELPDHLQVWPGHGAGSACGKSLGAVPQSTIGYERRFNWALMARDEDRFVASVLDGQPDPPLYFTRMKRLNRDGPPAIGVLPSTTPLSPDTLGALQRGGVALVDTRPAREFAAAHIPGSINIPLGPSFATWAGSVLTDDAVIALLIDGGEEAAMRALRALALIGIDEVRGIFDRTLLDAVAATSGLAPLPRKLPADLAAERSRWAVVDVRASAEWVAGHIPGAIHVPLAELGDALDRIPPGPALVHCEGGTRSVVAASVLRAGGRSDVVDLDGGFAAWRRAGLPVAAGRDPDTPTGAIPT
jgi:hydroxyacylglutathione hydrolase